MQTITYENESHSGKKMSVKTSCLQLKITVHGSYIRSRQVRDKNVLMTSQT